MSVAVQVVALLLIILGLMALLAAYRLRQAVRPTGHVDLVDSACEGYVPHGPLISPVDLLAGQPHGLSRRTDQGQVIPVTVIDEPAPPVPELASRMQVAAFCQLTEIVYDQSVPYGLLRYVDRDVIVEWTSELGQELSQLLEAMRAHASAEDVPRSHNDPAVCRACRVKKVCDQVLE